VGRGPRKWRSEQFRGRIIALWLSPVAEEEKERERKTKLEDKRSRRWRSSPSLSCTRFERISYESFKKEFTYLARYSRENVIYLIQ